MKGENACCKVILAFLNTFFCFCMIAVLAVCLLSAKELWIFVSKIGASSVKSVLEAEEKLNKIAIAGGFGEGFFSGVISENDAKKSIELFFENRPSNAQNNAFGEKIDTKILEFAKGELGNVSTETKAVLKETTDLCLNEINEVFSPRLLTWFCSFFERFRKAFLCALFAFSALFLSTFALLFKWDKSALKISLFSGGLCCFAGPLSLLFLINGKKLAVASVWVKDFITQCLNLSLVFMILTALIIFCFCIKKHPVV